MRGGIFKIVGGLILAGLLMALPLEVPSKTEVGQIAQLIASALPLLFGFVFVPWALRWMRADAHSTGSDDVGGPG